MTTVTFGSGIILGIFIYKLPPNFTLSFESIGLSVQEKKRIIDFQEGRRGIYLGFPMGTILASFDLQVALILPTKYRFGISVQMKKR